MANNHSLFTFIAGAAAGIALAAFLKTDKEKLNAVLDKVEDRIRGKQDEAPVEETEAETEEPAAEEEQA